MGYWRVGILVCSWETGVRTGMLACWETLGIECLHGKRNLSGGCKAPGGFYLCASLGFELKSLILAQIERWRHALHMQVERGRGATLGRVANG